MNANVLMEDASLFDRGITENEFHSLSQVRITNRVPSLEHSLQNTLELEEHPNFCGIEYPTLDRNCCDLLILVQITSNYSCHVPEANSVTSP